MNFSLSYNLIGVQIIGRTVKFFFFKSGLSKKYSVEKKLSGSLTHISHTKQRQMCPNYFSCKGFILWKQFFCQKVLEILMLLECF